MTRRRRDGGLEGRRPVERRPPGEGERPPGGAILGALVRVAIGLTIAFPLAYGSVMLYPELPTAVAIFDGVVLALAGTFAYFNWRCPRCRRPFAGRRTREESLSTPGTATVRDRDGFAHTVQTRRTLVVRTYVCRHCGEVFKR